MCTWVGGSHICDRIVTWYQAVIQHVGINICSEFTNYIDKYYYQGQHQVFIALIFVGGIHLRWARFMLLKKIIGKYVVRSYLYTAVHDGFLY